MHACRLARTDGERDVDAVVDDDKRAVAHGRHERGAQLHQLARRPVLLAHLDDPGTALRR